MMKAFYLLAKAITSSQYETPLRALMGHLSNKHNSTLTFRTRSNQPNLSAATVHPKTAHPSTAITLQGPIRHENDFTLNTLRYYAGVHPECPLILSTWIDENTTKIESSNISQVEIVKSPYPSSTGPSHINYQIASSAAGIRTAQTLGVSHVVKSRTDQRIYEPTAISLCHNISRTFPTPVPHMQKERLLGVSLNTYKYRLYPISDMFMFGTMEDMLSYWDAEHDERQLEIGHSNIRDYSKHRLCEVFLMTQFLEKMGRELDWTLKDSWRTLAEHFVVLDASMLDLFWPKYERQFQDSMYTNHEASTTREEMSFSDWLSLNTMNPIEAPEQVLELYFGDTIS